MTDKKERFVSPELQSFIDTFNARRIWFSIPDEHGTMRKVQVIATVADYSSEAVDFRAYCDDIKVGSISGKVEGEEYFFVHFSDNFTSPRNADHANHQAYIPNLAEHIVQEILDSKLVEKWIPSKDHAGAKKMYERLKRSKGIEDGFDPNIMRIFLRKKD